MVLWEVVAVCCEKIKPTHIFYVHKARLFKETVCPCLVVVMCPNGPCASYRWQGEHGAAPGPAARVAQ